MNSDNLQASNTKAITYAMGIGYAMVKAKVTWYCLFSFAYKTTIGMELYTRSYDLIVKTMLLPSYPYD
jgi:predicted transglutaminase-like protease